MNEPQLGRAISQLCTQAQCESPEYKYWSEQLHEVPTNLHRKQWEYCYISQVLQQEGMLAEGRRGIGFGVGREPLVAMMAARGCSIIASDMSLSERKAKKWASSGQHAETIEQLNARGICESDRFKSLVSYQTTDMNHVPKDLGGFDFAWSSCALEHLGSLERGMRFIRESLRILRPGGVAVHTTEYNLSSDLFTIPFGRTVLYRRRDILHFVQQVRADGHQIELNLSPGNGELDKFVDVPPYGRHPHLRRRIVGLFNVTSIGLTIKKAS